MQRDGVFYRDDGIMLEEWLWASHSPIQGKVYHKLHNKLKHPKINFIAVKSLFVKLINTFLGR